MKCACAWVTVQCLTSFFIASDNRSIMNLLIFDAFNHQRVISRPFLKWFCKASLNFIEYYFFHQLYLKISLSWNLSGIVIKVFIMIDLILAFVKVRLVYVSYRLYHTICFLLSVKLYYLCTTKDFISRQKEILWH